MTSSGAAGAPGPEAAGPAAVPERALHDEGAVTPERALHDEGAVTPERALPPALPALAPGPLEPSAATRDAGPVRDADCAQRRGSEAGTRRDWLFGMSFC